MAHLDPDTGEVRWNPAIKVELQGLHILETEEGAGEDPGESSVEMEAQADEEEEIQAGEGLYEEEEEGGPSDQRRDENDEY